MDCVNLPKDVSESVDYLKRKLENRNLDGGLAHLAQTESNPSQPREGCIDADHADIIGSTTDIAYCNAGQLAYSRF